MTRPPGDALPGPRAVQRCINADCHRAYPVTDVLVGCPACGWLLDVEYEWGVGPRPAIPALSDFTRRATTNPASLDFSGVWRFRELLPSSTTTPTS